MLALVARKERAEAGNAKNEAVGYLRESMETLDKSFIKISEIDLIDVPGMVRIRERLLEEAHKGYHDLLRRFQEGEERDGVRIRLACRFARAWAGPTAVWAISNERWVTWTSQTITSHTPSRSWKSSGKGPG